MNQHRKESYVSLQAAQPDDLTEKSDVDSADSSEVETQPAILMNQMIRLLKTNNKKESGSFNLTLNKIERSASLFY